VTGVPVDPSDAASEPSAGSAVLNPGPAAGGARAAAPRSRWREVVLALAVAGGVAASGAPLALLWLAVAPKVKLLMTSEGPVYASPTPEQFVADDGWFLFLTVGVGLLTALAVWGLARRYRGPGLLVAITVGSLAASLLAAWLGRYIALNQFHTVLAHTAAGTEFHGPALLRTSLGGWWHRLWPTLHGVVLAQPIAAALMYTLLAAFHVSPELNSAVEAEADAALRAT